MKIAKSKFIMAAAIVSALFFSQSIFAQKFDRNIGEKVTFVPKGQYLLGGNFTYDEYNANDYEFLVVNDLNGNMYSYKGSVYLGYFFRNNMTAGVKFSYKKNHFSSDKFNFDLSDDFDIDVDAFYSTSQMYFGTIFYRNYISLGKSRRFGLYSEADLTLGGGQGKTKNGDGEDLEGSFQNIYELQVGLTPGFVAFISDNVAIEASANIIGFDYTHYKQKKNQVYSNSLNHTSANLKIDLFSINLGVSFYIVPHKNRKSN